MSRGRHSALCQSAVVCALLAASTAAAQEQNADDSNGRFEPLNTRHLPEPVDRLEGYAGRMQLGGAYTTDDNFMFGEYNGLNEDGLTLIGNLQWQDFSNPEGYWRVNVSDLGLDTREGSVSWGKSDDVRLLLAFDSQRHIRNNSGRTPFEGRYQQSLPEDWTSGLTTGQFSGLDGALRPFDQSVKRDRLSAAFDKRLSSNWSLQTRYDYEQREGIRDTGAGIYVNGASADAVVLASPIDYTTQELDLRLRYTGGKFQLSTNLAWSYFDNDEDTLIWQNPYASYGERVAYPAGFGGTGLAPDNEQLSGRMVGHYLFSPTARLQFDGSYAIASQDAAFQDYTVNEALLVTEPLATNDLGGEVASGTFNGKLLLAPWRKLTAQLYYKLRDRDYDVDRSGYLYVRGDAADQPSAEGTVYNTAHDLTSQTGGLEVSYRLPMRSKLSAEYAYETIERRNSAVEETEEDRYSLVYRIQPLAQFSARLHLLYGDRSASEYQWAQSYFALLDPALINATPDNQRYSNHPELFQYHLANRERYESKLDLTFLPNAAVNVTANLIWRYDDFDQTNLGLYEAEHSAAHISASYAPSNALTISIHSGYERLDGNQTGRAFRGGQEKNPFEIFPPLPQASDPDQDWFLDATDHTVTAGATLAWQFASDYLLDLSYQYVDTRSEQALSNRPNSGNTAEDLPDVDTRIHHVEAAGTWQVSDDMSLRIDYQYYRFKTDDWSWDDVAVDTIDKVLSLGLQNPDEDLHYVGVSVIYRWQ